MIYDICKCLTDKDIRVSGYSGNYLLRHFSDVVWLKTTTSADVPDTQLKRLPGMCARIPPSQQTRLQCYI